MDTGRLFKALLAGIVLAAIGIATFFVMYFGVLPAAAASTRLFASLLVPPLVMGLVVVGYLLLRASKRT